MLLILIGYLYNHPAKAAAIRYCFRNRRRHVSVARRGPPLCLRHGAAATHALGPGAAPGPYDAQRASLQQLTC